MELVGFAVDLDTHVAAGTGFRCRDDPTAVLVATKGGNLGFGGSFGRFDHYLFCLKLFVFKCEVNYLKR